MWHDEKSGQHQNSIEGEGEGSYSSPGNGAYSKPIYDAAVKAAGREAEEEEPVWDYWPELKNAQRR
jgi:hypothetical protein